jgi:hypothetical protein
MPRLMYDSVNPGAIPRDAKLVAGYIDGSISKWPDEAWSWFPQATMVRISAVGSTWDADVFDVERGAIWPPATVVPLVVEARRHGRNPTVYVNEMNDWGPTRNAFRDAGVPEPPWWVANYNGVREIPPGSVGRQYAHPGASFKEGRPSTVPWETGRHWDESWIADHWPGVDDALPFGVRGAEEEREMGAGTFLVRGKGTGRIYLVTLTTTTRSKWHIPTQEISTVVSGIMGREENGEFKPANAVDVEDWWLDYIADEPGMPVPDVDEDAVAAPVIVAVLAALKDLPVDGLDFDETVSAVHEALYKGKVA